LHRCSRCAGVRSGKRGRIRRSAPRFISLYAIAILAATVVHAVSQINLVGIAS
jgi:hypothetical protein